MIALPSMPSRYLSIASAWFLRECLRRGTMLLAMFSPLAVTARVYRVMPVGDSITEGGSSFANWRFPLWEKLQAAGYQIEYVGSRKSPSRIGPLAHEGYGGKNSAFLARTVPTNFKQHPADIVLLHAGHNQFAEQKPVPGMLRDTEKMIEAFRAVNPRVVILLAQPIPSGKLPKYSYIPELHRGLEVLAKRLDCRDSPIRIVPQGEGFDPVKDTVADLVHPNARGAAKMTERWFEALVEVLEKPKRAYVPLRVPYKKTTKGDLELHVFKPAVDTKKVRPAIVFFFGGGWTHGTPLQFYPECAWFAERGFVAISADYRTSFTHGTTPFESVADGKSALRWIRQHAARLGIDPRKIVAAGGSAGGQVAAAAGMVQGLDEPGEDLQVSSRPDALALWYPVIDNGPSGYGDATVKARYREISPLHNVDSDSPPTIVFLGTEDALIPVSTIRAFEARMKAADVGCEVRLFPGAGHPIYSYRKAPVPEREKILRMTADFLAPLGIR